MQCSYRKFGNQAVLTFENKSEIGEKCLKFLLSSNLVQTYLKCFDNYITLSLWAELNTLRTTSCWAFQHNSKNITQPTLSSTRCHHIYKCRCYYNCRWWISINRSTLSSYQEDDRFATITWRLSSNYPGWKSLKIQKVKVL